MFVGNKLDITKLSCEFVVRFLTETDINAIYDLSITNSIYYQYCPPFVTKESIIEDMRALPPNKTYKDKYYIGFFRHTKLVAILDLILDYPNSSTAFIGLFMLDKSDQGKGTGTSIINECFSYIETLGYSCVRLAFAKGNRQSEAFWKKNGFVEIGIESKKDTYTAVVMQKELP